MFKKILIANRGEIACRIIKTAKKMGIQTVAVYSEADYDAPHMRMADEAILIGPAQPALSYLDGQKIIETALQTQAQAIHPGYGFLSENANFSKMCDDAGIIFIGPTAQTILDMGSKAAAKNLMEKAGVPLSPGYQGEDQTLETFMRESDRIGYPVLLKAVAGGGGKGMRLVTKAEDIEEALLSAQREAKSAFGDDRFLVEKYITRARHLEVQIFGDGKGNVVHMFERDCSLQRRHQKIIEEAPAPNLDPAVRKRLLEAGVAAAKAINYRGAGTVEFLYDGTNEIYFMEMNTRLQVEHPVSEEITGIDLVEWQLRIAYGESLPLQQAQIQEKGHAFEARLYAEDPQNNFAPSTGTLSTLRMPEYANKNTGNIIARIDSGVREGQEITPFYDPMIAKIITHGATRSQALGKMRSALEQTHIAGLECNSKFLHALTSEQDFIDGKVSTAFIEDHEQDLFHQENKDNTALAAWVLWKRAQVKTSANSSLAKKLSGWRLNRPTRETFWIIRDNKPAAINVSHQLNDHNIDEFCVTIHADASAASRRKSQSSKTKNLKDETSDNTLNMESFKFTGHLRDGRYFQLTLEGKTQNGFIAPHLDQVRVWLGAHTYNIMPADPLAGRANNTQSGANLTAPMPGTITAIHKESGDKVTLGDPLMVMEAMKMEHIIKAPADGVLASYRFEVGQQVKGGDLLLIFKEVENTA